MRVLLGLTVAILASPQLLAGCRVGSIQCDWSVAMESWTWHQPDGEESISRNEQVLELGLHTDPDRRWQVVTDIELVAGSKVPRVDLLGDGVVEEDERWQVRSDAAYVEFFDALEGLDVRIGRQVSTWGTADIFNPTDVLSSRSFENPIEFGENLPNPAVDVHYHLWGFDLNLLYVYKFQAPRLPPGLEQSFFTSNRIPAEFQELADQFLSGDGSLDITLNARVPGDSNWGVRVSRNIGGFDASVSYAEARESIPVLGDLKIPQFDPVALSAKVNAELFFPEKQMFGADFSGQLPIWGNPGIWAEVAWHEPEPLSQTISLLGQSLSETEVLTEGYVKYTVGGDYSLMDGTLIQGQLIRGFVDENERAFLDTYFQFGGEKSFFTDSLRVRLFEVYNLSDGSFLVTPDFLWYATDHVQVGVGGIVYLGDEGTKFGSIVSDEYFLKLRYAF